MNHQVKFKDKNGVIHGGIMIDDQTIICACCGRNLAVRESKILEIYNNWIDLTDFILGD